MSAICPECDSPIEVDAADVDVGDELSCSECGSLLRIANDAPLELESAEDEDEDDLDDEEDDEDEDDEDEDEEEEVEDADDWGGDKDEE